MIIAIAPLTYEKRVCLRLFKVKVEKEENLQQEVDENTFVK